MRARDYHHFSVRLPLAAVASTTGGRVYKVRGVCGQCEQLATKMRSATLAPAAIALCATLAALVHGLPLDMGERQADHVAPAPEALRFGPASLDGGFGRREVLVNPTVEPVDAVQNSKGNQWYAGQVHGRSVERRDDYPDFISTPSFAPVNLDGGYGEDSSDGSEVTFKRDEGKRNEVIV